MKNTLLNLFKYLYYLSLIILFILYLFPGSLMGYLLDGDLEKQPTLINTPLGTSINHFFYFFYLTILGLICNLFKKRFINSFVFLFTVSIILEMLHFFIPNRAFEYNDLMANGAGVVIVFFIIKLIKK